MARAITIPADQWHGEDAGGLIWWTPARERGDLVIEPNGVMAGIRPEWRTVVGWRILPGQPDLPGRPNRWAATVQVDAEALPPELRIAPGGAR